MTCDFCRQYANLRLLLLCSIPFTMRLGCDFFFFFFTEVATPNKCVMTLPFLFLCASFNRRAGTGLMSLQNVIIQRARKPGKQFASSDGEYGQP